MISALNSARQGLQQNHRDLERHADRISRGTGLVDRAEPAGKPVDLAREMVGVLQARRGFEANLSVLRVADEMLGNLLDIIA